MAQTQIPKVKALVLRTAGTNCDQETVHALKLCGAESDLIHVNQLLMGRVRFHPYQLLVIPGGFSYGDDISAGKVLANELRFRLKAQLDRFVEARKPVVGICNGFQVLVKTGLLPGLNGSDQDVTLTLNDSSRFQCEWTGLEVEGSAAKWLTGMPKRVEFPIAHAEGKFITANPKVLKSLQKNRQIFLRYTPRNPNGSEADIAGICNEQGNVVGMMPHPERFMSVYQHPNWPAKRIVGTETPGKPGRKLTKLQGELSKTKTQPLIDVGDGFWFWNCVVNYAKQFLN